MQLREQLEAITLKDIQIEMVADESALVGEGPVWDSNSQTLYWTDIRTGRYFQFHPKTRKNETIHNGIFVGGGAVNRHGGLTFGTWEGVMLWRSDRDWRWLHHEPHMRSRMQFNDVSVGPDGSFYAGTYYEDAPRGELFRFKPDGSHELIADGLGISNGMGWSPDLKTFYHTDSGAGEVYAYDHETTTGDLTNKRTLVKLPADEGIPDGMTVDAEGCIWSAVWGGAQIIRFDPDGVEMSRIALPAVQTSSVMFGGEDLTDIYVTTATFGSETPPEPDGPPKYFAIDNRGGQLYRIRQDAVQGKPEFETDFRWTDE